MWLPRSATTEEKLTTLPLPCSTITGTTCRQHRNGPLRSRLMVRSQTARSTSVTVRSSRTEPPAQFSSTSMRPKGILGSAHHLPDAVLVGYVGAHEARAVAGVA